MISFGYSFLPPSLAPVSCKDEVFGFFFSWLGIDDFHCRVKVATGGDTGEALPVLIRVPRFSDELHGYSLLGLGDIVSTLFLLASASICHHHADILFL